jgi:YVTN family beta-propeller protein
MRRQLIPLLFLALSTPAQTVDRPVRSVTDPGVVTTRQTITPAGTPTIFQGRVYGVAFGTSASEVWVLGATQLYRLDWLENRVLDNITHKATAGLQGLVYRGQPWVALTPRAGRTALFTASQGALAPVTEALGSVNAGALAVSANTAVLPLIAANKLAVIDTSSRTLRGFASTGIAPFGAAINRDGTVAYVSNWGGRPPNASEKSAPTGLDPNADRVAVDSHGIAAAGSVQRVDLRTLQATHTIPTGLHPNALAWDERRNRLYVANNNQDSITVIDTAANAVLSQMVIQPFATDVTGIAPTALALSGSRLFAACGGINAVAVIDTATSALHGLIPTAWYPNALDISPDGRHLAVGALLGVGSGWREDPRKRFVHSYRGSVNVLEIPGAAQLAAYTLAVSENNRLPLRGAALAAPPPSNQPRAIPVRPGDPSFFEHIVYIVKENRTYDQLFGDLPRGNGDPSLVMFGEDITPNQRRLATQFVLLDNFYATGGNSADGHQWLTQANEVAYTLWPGYQGRSYPFDGTDPLGIAQGGTIWDSARKAGKSVRVYGEYAGRLPEPGAKRIEYLQRWRNGEDFSAHWNISAPIAHMNEFLARNYPPYSNTIPDVIRAAIFLKDLARWERNGGMPNLTVMLLNCDHTFGTSPGTSSPRAMVADNDLALGMVVEAITKSKFWPKTAIFVVEDDAQNGVDHVDGHRTVALAVSPYTRRQAVDSTFYSQQSMLKTIELILGLPPLSLFDLIANDMRASFADVPDFAGYSHAKPKQDLFEVNPPASALKGEARRAALASARMRWDVPDAAPAAQLNRILWHSVRGWNSPFPGVRQAVFSPYSLD